MKFFLSVLMVCFCFNLNAQGDPGKGHPQHFVAGFVIAGATSFLVYKKTDNKLKSWFDPSTLEQDVVDFDVSEPISDIKMPIRYTPEEMKKLKRKNKRNK